MEHERGPGDLSSEHIRVNQFVGAAVVADPVFIDKDILGDYISHQILIEKPVVVGKLTQGDFNGPAVLLYKDQFPRRAGRYKDSLTGHIYRIETGMISRPEHCLLYTSDAADE